MSKSSVVMIVIVAVVAAVAIGGVVYGVATHQEPGFMPTRPSWTPADRPLVVCAHSYAGDDGAAEDAVRQAVGVTNDRLGFAMYGEVSGDDAGCDVRAVIGVPAEAGWRDPGGDAQFDPHRTTGVRCDITTTNTGTDEMLSLVLQHELGHCVGLAHDCWAGSIMCGDEDNDPATESCCTLAPTPDGQYPPRIDDSDRVLLRRSYLGE